MPTAWSESLNRALEAVEDVPLTPHVDLEPLVVRIPADVTYSRVDAHGVLHFPVGTPMKLRAADVSSLLLRVRRVT